ncbi:hypothetical protein D9613_001270 [Agrocybe pediades]|uniref:Uncharacterized protein n=1 Tax=Agrocybe pediades TaxID=84607 RepID=A0A8H4R754_9AGAR|nr:hypothetical protein D9613_001270 [Agrocybe pediades]
MGLPYHTTRSRDVLSLRPGKLGELNNCQLDVERKSEEAYQIPFDSKPAFTYVNETRCGYQKGVEANMNVARKHQPDLLSPGQSQIIVLVRGGLDLCSVRCPQRDDSLYSGKRLLFSPLQRRPRLCSRPASWEPLARGFPTTCWSMTMTLKGRVLLIGNGSSLSSVSGATDRKVSASVLHARDSLEMKSTVWLVIEGAVVDKSRTGVVEFIGFLLSETLSLSIALGFRSLYRLAAWNGISVRL